MANNKIIKNQDKIVRVILEIVNTNKIYVFGSCARNETHNDSDIDFYRNHISNKKNFGRKELICKNGYFNK